MQLIHPRLVPFLFMIAALKGLALNRPNVLFIVADDLSTRLGAYGDRDVKSPNIDRLASRGLVFSRAYCQQAICNASRASLLTGLRPDTTGVYDLETHFRARVPEAVTLPQQFKLFGYHTMGIGKIFHATWGESSTPLDGANLDDPPSWSVAPWRPSPRYYYTPDGIAAARRVFAAMPKAAGVEPDDWKNYLLRGPSTEAPDIPDNVLADGEIADRAIRARYELQDDTRKQPFFLAVGFLKPHIPFVAPKKYWDLYDPEKIALAGDNYPPKNAPPIALQLFGSEFRAYSDIPRQGAFSPETRRRLVHGYYACVSFVDAQIGRVLAELDRLGLAENTIVVLWGDHGYHLGEHSLWGKLTNFEGATHAPLIVSAPGMSGRGRRTDALVEFVDVFPGLCDLAGIPRPDHLEGTSFAPLLSNPDQPWKSAAFSQYWRRAFDVYRASPLAIPNPPGYDQYPKEATMGYSMRTDRYRLTLWQPVNAPGKVTAVELYDYRAPSPESENLAARPEYQPLVQELTRKLAQGWEHALPPRESR